MPQAPPTEDDDCGVCASIEAINYRDKEKEANDNRYTSKGLIQNITILSSSKNKNDAE